jgi:hypothetical protein
MQTSALTDLKQLNGRFRNSSNLAKAENCETLYEELMRDYAPFSDPNDECEGELVLEVLSQKRIKASIYLPNLPPKTKIIRGRFKNNFFIREKEILVFGVPFIFFLFEEKQTLIGLTGKNELIVFKNWYNISTILIFAGGADDGFLGHFDRIDKH